MEELPSTRGQAMRGLEDGTWRGEVGGVREDREGASDLVFFLTVHVKSCLFQSAFFAFLLRALCVPVWVSECAGVLACTEDSTSTGASANNLKQQRRKRRPRAQERWQCGCATAHPGRPELFLKKNPTVFFIELTNPLHQRKRACRKPGHLTESLGWASRHHAVPGKAPAVHPPQPARGPSWAKVAR
jgi:hypothetical protein